MVFEVEAFKVFVLVLARFSGLIVTAPVLGSRNFPAAAKIGLIALCAFIVVPVLPAQGPLPDEALAFALVASGELLIGLIMGFVMVLVFSAIQVAGQLIDMLTGFALINVFNPALETQVPVFGFFYFVLAVLYLLVLNGHHVMLQSLVSTFDKIPLGGFVMRPELLREVSTWGSAMFLDGLLIAAPVAGVLFLAYATMGLLSRVVPQINLLATGFPFTIAVGLLGVALTIELYLGLLDGMFQKMFEDVSTVIRGMA
jgi:flagellar biosynthesis protein FliR